MDLPIYHYFAAQRSFHVPRKEGEADRMSTNIYATLISLKPGLTADEQATLTN